MPHLQTRKIRVTCQRAVSVQIRKEIKAERRKPVFQRRTSAQSKAIAFSKVRKRRPKCREVLKRRRMRRMRR